jgi:hypothetical protein
MNSGSTNSGKIFLGDSSGTVLHIGHGGLKQLNITQAGKTGIGKTNPDAELHVYHASSNTMAVFESGDAGSNINLKDTSTTSSIEQNDTDFIISADNGASHANSNLIFKVDSSERMRVDSSGRLLINQTSVGSKSATAPLQLISATTGAFGVNISMRSQNDYGFLSFTDNDASEDLVQMGVQRSAADTGNLIIYTNGGNTSATERVRIDKNGQLVLSNGSMSTAYGNSICGGTNLELDTSGIIKFRTDTNQIASITDNGICFGSDSASANALDDFEKGNWTATIAFGGGTTGITYSQASGRYTKIGREVFCSFVITMTDKGSSNGNVTINGLPFTSTNDSEDRVNGIVSFMGGVSGIFSQLMVYNTTNTANAGIYDTNGHQGDTSSSASITDSNFSNSTHIRGFINYRAA